jgi:hypothetical protein
MGRIPSARGVLRSGGVEASKAVLGIVVGWIFTGSGAFLTRSLGPDWGRDLVLLVVASGLFAAAIQVVILVILKSRGRRDVPLWQVAVGTFALSSVVLFSTCRGYPVRGTAYFVVDASENMRGRFADVPPQVLLGARRLDKNLDLGMVVGGGGGERSDPFQNLVEVVELAPHDTAIEQIETRLDRLKGLTPQGPTALQPALVEVVTKKLAGRRGRQQVLVYTAGGSSSCEQLDRAALNEAARKSGVSFDLRMYGLGPISTTDERVLKLFAGDDGYKPLTSTAEIAPSLGRDVAPARGPYGGPYGWVLDSPRR